MAGCLTPRDHRGRRTIRRSSIRDSRQSMMRDENAKWMTRGGHVVHQPPEPTYEFIVPAGTRPGDRLQISGPQHALPIQVVVPANVWPGARLVFSLPECAEEGPQMSAIEVAAEQGTAAVSETLRFSWLRGT